MQANLAGDVKENYHSWLPINKKDRLTSYQKQQRVYEETSNNRNHENR